MKRKFINKIILGSMISSTLFTLLPIKASADWVNDNQGNWYYMQGNSKLTGWKRIDGQLYYFDENGKMQKGWIKAGDYWYFLSNNGRLRTGWINYNNNWYYADSTGAIQTGVINIAGKVYIFDDNGVMKTRNIVINGQFYTIGSNGEVVGAKVPEPDKEIDGAGNLVQHSNNADTKVTGLPTDSKFNTVIEDQTESNDDPNEGRTFTLTYRDSNGAELKSKSVKYGKTVDLYEPTKDDYKFSGWNTKSDGSGKSYDSSDSIKIKEDITLYAQWSEDTSIYAESITIKGSSYVTANKTVQMTAEVSPSDVTSNAVAWTVENGTGSATIDSNGVLTGVSTGTVTVKATTKDGSDLSATKEVTVSASDVTVPVTSITVSSKSGGTPAITTDKGTLQMVASVSPDGATTQGVTWSVENRTGSASIDSNGLVTAISNGTATIKATATDGSGVVGSTTITISGQSTKILIDSITITGKDSTSSDVSSITTDGGTLQMIANILPTTASNKAVNWSIISGQDKANIDSNGVLTALADGTVTVQGKTTDGTGKVATKDITISNQAIKVSQITITGPYSVSGTSAVNMNATVIGKNSATPTNSVLKWTVASKTGSASIDTSTGELTPKSDGVVTVKALATDGSGVYDSKDVTISGTNTNIPVTSISVAAKNGSTSPSITTDDGTLDLAATILPTYSTTTSSAVKWEVLSGSDGGTATIVGNTVGSTTTIKALTNGSVTVRATITDSTSTKTGTINVTIDNQIQQVQKVEITTPNNSNIGVNETLQMNAKVTAATSDYSKVKWEVSNGTGTAIFDSTTNGLLKGLSKGTVTVRAISTDGYNLASDPVTINIVDPVPATTVTVTGPIDSTTNNETTSIAKDKGTLKMTAAVDSAATNKAVTWSVESLTGTTNGAGKATYVDNGDSTATITAVENGDVKVIATGSGGVTGYKVITISGQNPASLAVSGYNGVNQINILGGTLQMLYSLVPSNATTPASVTWSVSDTTKATINSSTGVLTAVNNGTVVVTATATTANNTKVSGTATVTINGITGITITGGNTTVAKGTVVSLSANILPSTAVNKTVTWSVANADASDTASHAIFSSTDSGNLITLSAGTVIVTATANDGSGKTSSAYITITN